MASSEQKALILSQHVTEDRFRLAHTFNLKAVCAKFIATGVDGADVCTVYDLARGCPASPARAEKDEDALKPGR